jgi:hypothetical protein
MAYLKNFHEIVKFLLLHGAKIVCESDYGYKDSIDVLMEVIVHFHKDCNNYERYNTLDLILCVDRRDISDVIISDEYNDVFFSTRPLDPSARKIIERHAIQKPVLSLKFLTIRFINTNRISKPDYYPHLLFKYNHKISNKRN